MPQNEYSKNTAYPRAQFTQCVLRQYPETDSAEALNTYGQRVLYAYDALKYALKSKANTYCDLSELTADDQVAALISHRLEREIDQLIINNPLVEIEGKHVVCLPAARLMVNEFRPYLKITA